MSKITIAIRFSDNKISTIKAHKSNQYMNFSNILYLLDEELLKKYFKENNHPFKRSAKTLEEHQDYNEDLAFFAPYTYGITFIDFKNKVIYDYNDYSIFMGTYAVNIKLSLSKVLFYSYRNHPTIKIQDIPDDFYLNAKYPCFRNDGYYPENVFQILNPENSSLFNIYQAYKQNIPIYYMITDKKNGFIKKYITSSNISDLFQQISELNDMSIIRFEIPGWIFNSGSIQKNKYLLKTLKKDVQFSEEELIFWENPVYTNY